MTEHLSVIVSLPLCSYLKQVLDETLRTAVIGPWAARFQEDSDTMLGGHVIPKGVSIILKGFESQITVINC